MSADQADYVWRNRKGKALFKPVFEQYKDAFIENLIKGTTIVADFEAYKDTALTERHILNVVQFSAAKTVTEGKLMQAAIYKPNGTVRDFNTFEKECRKITTISNEIWLRVELESHKRQVVMGEQFSRMVADKEYYPYWIWVGRMDGRERQEHVEMEKKVFRIGDPAGDKCYPPADFNCRCDGEAVDDDYLRENGLAVLTGAEALKHLEENISEPFRMNPAIDGTMPRAGSYFEAIKSANDLNYQTFGLNSAGGHTTGEQTGLTALLGLHNLIQITEEWRKKEGTNNKGDIIFQCKELYSNVRFTTSSLNSIHKHPVGFTNIPDTIKHPAEVWSYWEDAKDQHVVIRNYIRFYKSAYIVKTRDGVIVDAFSVSCKQADKYRIGIIL